MRRFAGLAAAVLALVLAVPSATAAPAAYRANDYGTVLNVLPPGSDGSITALQGLEAGSDRVAIEGVDAPSNFADQLEMYDALARKAPGTLTEASLSTYFKDASFGVPAAELVSTITPRPGVTIQRDTAGVPHVYGDTYEDAAYGAGYVGTYDRMFLQDLLRHVGAARTVEFLGPSASNKKMDVDQLRVAGYTVDEATEQIDHLSDRFGAEGERFERGVDAFVAGINAAQDAMCPGGLGVGPECPPEYAALQILPSDFERADLTYIASLVGGIFGRGGGDEYRNGLWLQQLQQKFGAAEGKKVFEDLRERDDPEAPTTVTTSFPYNRPGAVDQAAVAMPDAGAPVQAGTGGVTLPSKAAPGPVDGPFGPIDLFGQTGGMSNALVVGAKETTSGHPIAVFGPQTGYFSPQLLTEIDLHGPGIDARGVSFAGTQAIVQLGRGRDYAWSATSAGGDNVDQLFEQLCNADGSPATLTSTSYVYQGECVPMVTRTHTQIAKTSAGGTDPPEIYELPYERTVHGPVLLRTMAEGKPAALVAERSTFGGEIDSGIGFMRINDPDYVDSATDFQRAFDGVGYTFNWFYIDDKDIAYFESGKLPMRDPRVHPDLPRWGTGEYEWQGWLPFGKHPQAINPPSGFFANWNNKPAPGFSANDGEFGYGSIHRSQTLQRRIEERIVGAEKVSRPELVEAMADGALVDARADNLLDLALDVVGPVTGDSGAAAALLRAWTRAGALREDRDRTGGYSHQAAIAVWEAWYPRLAKDVLRGTLGDLVDELPQGMDDHPSQHIGSSWNGIAWYGYVDKDLRQSLGRPVRGRYSRTYCGGGSLATCRSQLRASLAAAVAAARAAGGDAAVGALTYAKSRDEIQHVVAGLVGVRPMDWQNRPTFQQVATFDRHRPRTAGHADPVCALAPTAPGCVRGGPIPSTGAGPAGALIAAALVGAAAWGVRLRA